MIKGLGDLGGLMQKAQEMQARMAEMQEEMSRLEVEGEAGGGMVKLTMTGKGDLKGVQIDASLLAADDKEMLEDLLVAAHGDARSRAEARMQEEMQKITADMPIPPGMKLPF